MYTSTVIPGNFDAVEAAVELHPLAALTLKPVAAATAPRCLKATLTFQKYQIPIGVDC